MACEYFISYRRDCGGETQAKEIAEFLCKYVGEEKVFYDINSINQGEFPAQIEQALREAKFFILLINKAFLRDNDDGKIDWYYEEIRRGIKNSNLGTQKITPIVYDKHFIDFDHLPEEFLCLKKCQKCTYNHEYGRYFEDRLCRHFGFKKKFDIFGQQYECDYNKFKFYENFLTDIDDKKKKMYGREAYAERLFECFFKDKIYLICVEGMGGIGKTAFANIFKQKCIDEHKYKHIHHFYLNKNIYKDFIENICALINDDSFSKKIKSLESDAIKKREIIEVLSGITEGPNLLILDINVKDDNEFNTDFLDGFGKLKERWNILILARKKFNGIPDKHRFELPNMASDKKAAVQMFRTISGITEIDCSDEDLNIVFATENFNYHPLLIEVLASHCKRNNKKCFDDIYGSLKTAMEEELPQELTHGDPKLKYVYHYLSKLISFDEFDCDIQILLRHFILWPYSNIPIDVIKILLSEIRFEHSIEHYLIDLVNSIVLSQCEKEYRVAGYSLSEACVLAGYSDQYNSVDDEKIIEYLKNKGYAVSLYDGYRMHEVLADVLRQESIKNGIYKYNEYLSKIKQILSFSNHTDFFHNLQECVFESLYKNAEVSKPNADLYIITAQHYYFFKQQYQNEVYSMALKSIDEIGANHSIEIADALHNFARVLIEKKEYEIAQDAYQKAVSIRKRNDHIDYYLALEYYCLCILTQRDENWIKCFNDGLKTIRNQKDYRSCLLQYLFYKMNSKFENNHEVLLNGIVKHIDSFPEQYLRNPAMVLIEGGDFLMGCDDMDSYQDERPAHKVTLQSFKIGKYPITQFQWDYVMGNEIPSTFRCDIHHGIGPNYPMYKVSWQESIEFCNCLSKLQNLEEVYTIIKDNDGKIINVKADFFKNGYRLPSEAEWEFAARDCKTDGTKYSGSDDIDEVAWYQKNADARTHSVGEKLANKLGIYDMSGNVWEWCQDCWDGSANYDKTPCDGSANTEGYEHILRGGGWTSNEKRCRVSRRSKPDSSDDFHNVGFRVVLNAPNESVL